MTLQPDPNIELQAKALVQVSEVPADVRCIRITAVGAWQISFTVDTSLSNSASISIAGLPTGTVTFHGEAFEKACEDVLETDQAEWRSTPVSQVLYAGTTVSLMLVLRRNGIAEIDFGFQFAQACTPAGNECGGDEFCFTLACGDTGGGCLKKPQACAQAHDPVCGCNGATYTNACEAAAVGQPVAHKGACRCGGSTNISCTSGFYCAYPADTCSVPEREGVCSALPVACPATLAPVCGCNNKTYRNECEAAGASVAIAHVGACIPQVCGGPTRIACADATTFCAYPDATCSETDRFGTCQERPKQCPTVQFAPVCACNRKSYTNRCLANAVGLSVQATGYCPAP